MQRAVECKFINIWHCPAVQLSIYSAQLTAFLTISKIKTSVQSITDLRGRAVGSLEVCLTNPIKL